VPIACYPNPALIFGLRQRHNSRAIVEHPIGKTRKPFAREIEACFVAPETITLIVAGLESIGGELEAR